MGRLKKIKSEWTQKEKFNLCFSEAGKLYHENEDIEERGFYPELDNLTDNTVASVMFKVLHEWDLWSEGLSKVPKSLINRSEKFFIRWREHIENKYVNELSMYDRFN